MHSLTARRYRRLEESPAAVLENLPFGNPLYVHARNWMAEMAAIIPISGCFPTDDGWLSFPEQGLSLHLPAIHHLHSVSVDHPSRPSVALEIATQGEPRSVSIAAIPLFSDIASLEQSLATHPSLDLTSDEYDAWRSSHLIRPTACPCCADAAKSRRENAADSPLARIFSETIEAKRTLHCQLSSDSFRFSRSFVPNELNIRKGQIVLTGDDHTALLEIDPGICHSLKFNRELIDGEPSTLLHIANSLGRTELVISTEGFEVCSKWAQLCEL